MILALLMLSGCAGAAGDLDRAMALRSRLLGSKSSFDVMVTADYGDEIYTFSMACQASVKGEVQFTVTEPKSIAGIAGSLSPEGGKLHFDEQVLAFPMMADEQFSPVSAPWILMKTLRSGYLTSAGQEGEYLRAAIDDSYAEDALHLDVWLDDGDLPVRAEVLWKGRRLLSMEVKNFQIG